MTISTEPNAGDAAATTATAVADPPSPTATDAQPTPVEAANLPDPGSFEASKDTLASLEAKHMGGSEPDDAAQATEADAAAPDDGQGQPAAEDDEPTDGEAADESRTEDGGDAQPDDLEKAIAALQRDGLSRKAIETLHKADPQGFVKDGLKRAKVQLDQSRYINSLRQGKPPAGAAKAEAGDEAAEPPAGNDDRGGDAEDAAAPAGGDVFAQLEGLADDDLLDGAQAKGLVQVVRQQQETIARMEAETSQRAVVSELNRQRDALKGEYAGLADDAAYQRVIDRYNRMVRGDTSYETIGDAFADAAKLELGDESAAAIRDGLLKKNKAQRRGAPRAPSGQFTKTEMTPEQQEMKLLADLEQKHMAASR